MLSVLQYCVIFYYPPCILLFQSEFCLSLQDCGQFQPLKLFRIPERNETKRKLRVFFLPSRYKIFFLRFKKKKKIITESSYKSHHRTNHFIRLESNFLLITIHFLLSAFENFKPGLNTYSRETEGKREQTIINKFPTIITLLHRDIQPNSLLRNLPLPSLPA